MDISLAKNILGNTIKAKVDDLAILTLASDVLNDTFEPDFATLATAQAEANDFAQKYNAEKHAHQTNVATLTAEKQNLANDLETKTNDLAEAQATFADNLSIVAKERDDLQKELDDLKAENSDAVTPPEMG